MRPVQASAVLLKIAKLETKCIPDGGMKYRRDAAGLQPTYQGQAQDTRDCKPISGRKPDVAPLAERSSDSLSRATHSAPARARRCTIRYILCV